MVPSKIAKNSRFLILAALMSAAGLCVEAEVFRVNRTHEVRIKDALDKTELVCGPDDAIRIILPEDKTFIQGIEISVKVPKLVAEWRDCVAWSFYSGIKGQGYNERAEYEGSRIRTGTFGTSLSQNIKIPVSSDHTIKRDNYSVLIEEPVRNSDGNFFFRLQIAMKGISDDIFSSKFSISVKPILKDQGMLRLNLITPEGEKLQKTTLFVDGKEMDFSNGALLKSGSHDISLVSDFYRNEVRTVSIVQAQTTELEIQLRDIKPVIRIAAPEKTKVFFDNIEFTAPVDPFNTTQGEHTIRFSIGDYEIVRTVNAANGRNYNVSVNLEAMIVEEN